MTHPGSGAPGREREPNLSVLAVADCPQCKQESCFRHKHDTAYGLEATHMVGSERFECAFCNFVVLPKDADKFPTLVFVLDRQ